MIRIRHSWPPGIQPFMAWLRPCCHDSLNRQTPDSFLKHRPLRHMALSIVVCYLALSSMAAYCLASHAPLESSSHQHSTHTMAHSLLCSWACQVSSKAGAADTTTPSRLTPVMMAAGTVSLEAAVAHPHFTRPTPSRGPPL